MAPCLGLSNPDREAAPPKRWAQGHQRKGSGELWTKEGFGIFVQLRVMPHRASLEAGKARFEFTNGEFDLLNLESTLNVGHRDLNNVSV